MKRITLLGDQAVGTQGLPAVLETSELRVTCQIVTRQHRDLLSVRGPGKEIFHYPIRGWPFFYSRH